MMEEKEYKLIDWQEEILEKFDADEIHNEWYDSYDNWQFPPKDKIVITRSQAVMLEKVLGDDFFISDTKIRKTLERVFSCGYYYDKDKEILNLARECYLKGRNWIKENK